MNFVAIRWSGFFCWYVANFLFVVGVNMYYSWGDQVDFFLLCLRGYGCILVCLPKVPVCALFFQAAMLSVLAPSPLTVSWCGGRRE